MNTRLARFIVPAVLAASIPVAAVFAQGQGQSQPPARSGPSAEVQTRLQDGRIAMIKEALKLNDDQLKLWAPVEEQLRARFAARQEARAERRERRKEDRAERPTLPERLDQRAKRLTERAERMKSFSEALTPLYASLSDDQKAVASVVLSRASGLGGRKGHRSAMHRYHHGNQR